MASNEANKQTASKGAMEAGNTSYFSISSNAVNKIRQERINTNKKAQQEIKNTDNNWAIISFIASIVPICLWTYCFIASHGNSNEGTGGAVWWLMIIYYWSLGIPLLVMSLAFGIRGLKTKLRWLSITSITIKIATILTLVVILLIGMLH